MHRLSIGVPSFSRERDQFLRQDSNLYLKVDTAKENRKKC